MDQQGSQPQQQQQQTDWDSLLADVLLVQLRQEEAADRDSSTPRALHRVSRRHRAAARAAIRHLKLRDYGRGRRNAQSLLADGQGVPAGLAAAAVPAIPWDLLAATPSLTSLDLRAPQLGDLLAGSPPGGGSGDAAAAGAAAETAAGPNVLAATLSRLRHLVVSHLRTRDQVRQLGRLLGSSPHLTKLELVVDNMGTVDATPLLLQGLAEAAPAGQATAGEPKPGAAAAGSTSAAAGRLPPLQHLDIYGMSFGLPDPWLAVPAAAARLTTLQLAAESLLGSDLGALAACVGLKELVLRDYPGAGQDPLQLPEELSRLTGLTQLVVRGCQLVAVPDVVWRLTALRHLNLADNHGFDSIPSDISHLKQLQLLDMSDPGVPELPEELGTWLPQLEVLQVDYTPITAVPKGLTRLTRLNISGTFVRYLADLPHDLGALKQLVLHQSMLRPPLEGLSRLSALETLHLGWQEEPSWDLSRASCLPGPLPRLTSLNLCAVPPGLLAGLRGGMGVQGVTHLTLEALERQHMAAVAQLGVLPHLKHLVLMGSSGISWAALGAWLHQQPSLVRLRLSGGRVEGQELQQLPEQLEELVVCWCQLPDGQLPNLAHLTRLRCLHVDHVHHLPPWLTALSSLEELVLLSSGGVLSGAEVLAQLPNLRRVAGSGWQRGACRRAPHLCWAERTSL